MDRMYPEMKNMLLQISDELDAAIETARGTTPRNPWIEQQLWRIPEILEGAETAGVENPHRPLDSRGLHMKTTSNDD